MGDPTILQKITTWITSLPYRIKEVFCRHKVIAVDMTYQVTLMAWCYGCGKGFEAYDSKILYP